MKKFDDWYDEPLKSGQKRKEAIKESISDQPEVEVWLSEASTAGQNKISLEDKESICSWHLSFTFSNKQQCLKAIEYIQDEEILFSYFLDIFNEPDGTKYTVIIPKGVWANNLTAIARALEKVDFEL